MNILTIVTGFVALIVGAAYRKFVDELSREAAYQFEHERTAYCKISRYLNKDAYVFVKYSAIIPVLSLFFASPQMLVVNIALICIYVNLCRKVWVIDTNPWTD